MRKRDKNFAFGVDDEERARQAYRKAKDALNVKGDDLDLDAAQAALKRAAVRLKIAEYHRRRK